MRYVCMYVFCVGSYESVFVCVCALACMYVYACVYMCVGLTRYVSVCVCVRVIR